MIVEICRRDRFRYRKPTGHVLNKLIRFQQQIVGNKDVINTFNPSLVQLRVIHPEISLVNGQIEREMEVVVKVGTRGNDKIDKTLLNQGNEYTAHPGWRHGA